MKKKHIPSGVAATGSQPPAEIPASMAGEEFRPDGAVAAGKTRKRWLAPVLGVALALLAAYVATSGMTWSLFFHPDEHTVAHWIDEVRDSGYITSRAYPGGWFELFRIRMWFERMGAKWDVAWNEHTIQDGRVIATDANSFSPREAESLPERFSHGIKDGRSFNAWLYVLTVLFLFAGCLEAGLHPVAAFVSGLFFLTAAGPMEFVHYCETDAGLLVAMAFFAWLAARAIRKRSLAWALAGAFAAGFAVSCKFTLAPLLLWCFVAPAAVRGRGGIPLRRWLPRAAGVAVAGVLLAFGGYLLGTPALRIAPAWYREALRLASESTYGEILQNLGGNYSWWRATVLRMGDFVRNLGEIGVLPVMWGVFAWTFWFSRRFRGQLAGIPWLLPVFVPFLVCWCPFVRRQEMLPLSILFAFGAGIPLQWVLSGDGCRRLRGRRWLAVATFAFAACALTAQAFRGAGMMSCFLLRDTRVEAQNWLRASLPTARLVAFDSYVPQIARGTGCTAESVRGLPYCWPGHVPGNLEEERGYYVENVGFMGRLPIRDPEHGGRLFPHVLKSVDDYNAAVFDVRTWGVSSGTVLPVFGQPRVRLVSFERPAPDAVDVPLGHSRPVMLLPHGVHLYDAAGPAWLGPFRAIHAVGKRSAVHPCMDDGPRWLVTRMLAGGEPVTIACESLFSPGKSRLVPGGAVAARLNPGVWERMMARAAARSTSRIRMRGDDQATCCASYLTSSAADAARELREAGDAAAALALLREAAPLDAAGSVEAFLAASVCGIAPEASWVDAASNALAAADRLASERDALGRTGATLCGVPVGILDDFARIKLGKQFLQPGWNLSVWLPPGRYELAVTVAPEDVQKLPERLFDGQTADFGTGRQVGRRCVLSVPLEISTGRFLSVAGQDFEGFAADLELVWSPVDRVLETAEVLRAALGRTPAP